MLCGVEGTLPPPCKQQVEAEQAATTQGSPGLATTPTCQGECLATDVHQGSGVTPFPQ